MQHSWRSFRRTFLTAGVFGTALATMAAGGVGTSSAAPAGDAASGTASAVATSYKLNPTAAGLSLGISFGQSI